MNVEGADTQPDSTRILHRMAWRRAGCVAGLMAAMLACLAGIGAAQEDRPQISPDERKVVKKKDATPRALGVMRLSADGKASLVPVVILIDKKFFDASAYKADPIPMSLDTGVVYEVERAGSSQGLFTVNSALHSNAVNAPTPWLATGKWAPAGADDAAKPMKAESVPVGIDNSDEPPRLTKDPAAVHKAPGTPASSTPASTSDKPAGSSGSGDEPPRLSRGADSSAPSGTAPAASPAPPPANPPSKTEDKKSSDSKPADITLSDRKTVPQSDSGASDANRPRLRRGMPAALPDDDVPGYSKPGKAASAAGTMPGAAPGPVQLMAAISDAGGPPPHSFHFEWLKDEEGERRKQMEDLAKAKIKAYVEERAKGKISSAPGPKKTALKKTAEPVLENPQMVAYDLWGNNQPVILFAAEAHLPPVPGAPGGEPLQYSIMLAARTDIYNNLHTLYSGVTDKFHLDLTPRLELIDAVDADGDGRGELLFRETTDAGMGWLIYRANQDKLWKVFDSLNPE